MPVFLIKFDKIFEGEQEEKLSDFFQAMIQIFTFPLTCLGVVALVSVLMKILM